MIHLSEKQLTQLEAQRDQYAALVDELFITNGALDSDDLEHLILDLIQGDNDKRHQVLAKIHPTVVRPLVVLSCVESLLRIRKR